MTQKIRKTTKADCDYIAACLLLAMEEILYNFTGHRNYQIVKDLMLHFVKTENNQYSYNNCLVAEHEGKVIAAVNYYDGSDLVKLRQPILDYIRANYNSAFNPEMETEEGEIYIDSLGVNPLWQGKGLATQLLRQIITEFALRKGKTVGLIVEPENEKARRLYLKLGFSFAGMKTLAGKRFEHFQISKTGKREE
jgi:ribosomal protein S18 acetylase RimI-like enzyme